MHMHHTRASRGKRITRLENLLARNQRFARTSSHVGAEVMPTLGVGILTCLDPRVDPAAFLGLGASEAMVLRNAGGRVTDRVIADVSFTTYMARMMGASGLELAVIHHTGCGTGFLADDGFRAAYAKHSGFAPEDLLAEAVTDPLATVQDDTAILLTHPALPDQISVSGHVYDLETGLVTTVVPATPRAGAESRTS